MKAVLQNLVLYLLCPANLVWAAAANQPYTHIP